MSEKAFRTVVILWLLALTVLTVLNTRTANSNVKVADGTNATFDKRLQALEKEAAKNKEVDKMITDLFPPVHTDVRELKQKVAALEGAKAPAKKP